MQLLLPIVNLYLVVYYVVKKSDFMGWNLGFRFMGSEGLYCSSYSVKAHLHSFKTASPVASGLILVMGDSNGL